MTRSFRELVGELSVRRRKRVEEEKERLRREIMASMAEFSLNPASIVSKEQEQVALFMVEQLQGSASPSKPYLKRK